MTEQCSWKASW